MTDYFGAVMGLAAAACWAVASVWYVRVPMGAGALTTCKNVLATACMLAVLWTYSLIQGTPMFQASSTSWWDISLSGVIGLCIADIAYFRSIQILGARRGLTLTLLTPPTTALLAQIWLGDVLSVWTWCWIALTLLGVGIVMRQRTSRNVDQEHRPGSTRWGVCCALMGIGTMAVGAVVMKSGLTNVAAIEGTCIRLLAASGFGICLSMVMGHYAEIVTVLRNPDARKNICTATLVGTVMGVCLMLTAYKYCETGVAATLTSTTPLFVIPVVYFAYREKISSLAIVGAAVAFGGVCGLLVS